MFGDAVSTSIADRIYRWLLEEFHAGRIPAGGRLPSENELCARFGVSRPQVRLALARLAHEALVETRRGKGSFRREIQAAANRDIAVVLPKLDSYVYPELVVAAGEAIRRRGCQALFDCSDCSIAVEGEILRRLAERRPAGLLISPLQPESGKATPNLELLKTLRAQGTAVVLIDNTLGDHSFSSLVVDDYAAGRRAAEYLLNLGHRRPAVCLRSNHAPYEDRARGFLSVLEERCGAAALFRRELWRSQDERQVSLILGGAGLASGAEARTSDPLEALEALLSGPDRPSALFCAGDELAFLVREAARRSGVAVPGGLSLVGFDDSPVARLPEVALTTFVYPSAYLGRRGAEILIDALESDAPAVRICAAVDPVLMERATAAPPADQAE